jgi:hypothetical protein
MTTRIPLAAALFAIAPASLQAVTYSDYVLGLNPTTYFRLDQAVTTPGTVLTNLGTLGAAANGSYFTYGGGTTATTGVSGGAIAGNAGVTTTGFAATLTDGAYVAHTDRWAVYNNSFTLSLWVKPTSFGIGQYGCAYGYGEAAGHDLVIYQNGGTGNGFLVSNGSADLIASSATMTVGAWNHIGLTWNGSTMQLYINGTADNTWTGTMDSYVTYGNIGGYYTGAIPFNGGIDEVAYFNGTALTGTQMAGLANAAIPEPNTFALLGLAGAAALSSRRRMPRSAALH